MGKGGLPGQHVAAGILRRRLQAEGFVYRISEGRVVRSGGAAEIPDRREAGVNAGSDPDRLAEEKATLEFGRRFWKCRGCSARP